MILSTKNNGYTELPFMDKIKKFFEDLFDVNLIKPFGGNKEEETTQKTEAAPKTNSVASGNEARNYIIKMTKQKTFDEWLASQGLSREENSQNYFGSYYKKAANALLSQSYTDKEYQINKAKNLSYNQGLATSNNYKTASSNFSEQSERMYDLGMKNSGFDSYLKGLSYLAYRDELSKNSANLSNSIANAEREYKATTSTTRSELAENIQKREEELLKLYLNEINSNNELISNLT